MAKDKTQTPESWHSRMKDFGGGDFTFLSTDGETLIFIIVGLPELLKGTYKGKEQERIGIPIVTDEGFQLLVGGKRMARKISKFEKHFDKSALMVTRVGAEGDINAKYPVSLVTEKETFERLKRIASEDFEPDMIQEAIKGVSDVLKG
jgi:hypothetical protein